MPRVINYLERISDDFDKLADTAKAAIVAELFSRLDRAQAAEAMMLMSFWQKRQGYNTETKPAPRKTRGNSTPVPPLMDRAEVESAGKLALEPAKGGTQ